MTSLGSLALGLDPDWPEGFVYRPDVIHEVEERALVDELRALTFADVRMRGQVARRRTVHFGWLYGYEGRAVEPGPPMPAFLSSLRERAGQLAAVAADDLAEVLVTEYTPGAAIGWHRDAPMFGAVVGVSLLGTCRFRFRRTRTGERDSSAGARPRAWDTREVTLPPRSAYVLRGAARWAWQHSIPPTKSLRYSITFRTLRADHARRAPGVER